MNIDIYSDYKVIWCSSGSYISQEDSLPNDVAFSKYESDNTFIINGGELIDKIVKLLNDDYIQCFSVTNNTIRIELFNCSNGICDDYIITIERIDKLKKQEIF